MSATAAALLIALRCLAPACPSDDTRAPAYVRCPVCVESWVIVVNEWAYPSPWTEVRDQCGRIHWHDNGTESHTYQGTEQRLDSVKAGLQRTKAVDFGEEFG